MLVLIMNTTFFLQSLQFVVLALCLNFHVYFFPEQIVLYHLFTCLPARSYSNDSICDFWSVFLVSLLKINRKTVLQVHCVVTLALCELFLNPMLSSKSWDMKEWCIKRFYNMRMRGGCYLTHETSATYLESRAVTLIKTRTEYSLVL